MSCARRRIARKWMSELYAGSAVSAVASALLLGSTATGLGQWPDGTIVEQTPHNLLRPAQVPSGPMANRIEDYGEICVYCHTAHGGSTAGALWNRSTPAGPFRMYDRGTDMIMDPQPTGNSLVCLSCHDGTIGLDEIIVSPHTYGGAGPIAMTIDRCENCHSGGNPAGGIDWEGVFLDTDLRDDHPISITYDPALDPTFRTVAEVEFAGLVLYDGKVQCMTCHEPHSEVNKPFLRVDNAGGTLCLVCHTATPADPPHNM